MIPECPPSAASEARLYSGVNPHFCDRIGVAKKRTSSTSRCWRHAIREDLNRRAPRVMCVLKPCGCNRKLPRWKIEYLEAINNPEDSRVEHEDSLFNGIVDRSRLFQ